MLFPHSLIEQTPLRRALSAAYRMNETECLEQLVKAAALSEAALERVAHKAHELVAAVRDKRLGKGGLDAFMYQYDLSNEEGIALMCLAEALLRVPDESTANRLIRDKIINANWQSHAGKSESMFVNAATWGLMLTGRVYAWNELQPKNLWHSLKRLAGKGGEPVIRKSANYAMSVLGKQFVMGRTIEEALKRSREAGKLGYRYSYDMLGEAARTAADAARYFQSYQQAIDRIGQAANGVGPIQGPGISVKLSALHPRYELAKYQSVMAVLIPRVKALALQAKSYDLNLTIDAEEADRLDLSLDIFAKVFLDPELNGWEGFGLALQSYQKRAYLLLDWLQELAGKAGRRIMLRLIKGAYWDSEIKDSQVRGLSGYPVFTRKSSTDVSFLACAKKILAATDAFYPQFATHNAYSVAAILEMAGDYRDYEFQCLHGMGRTLYDEIVGSENLNLPCRIYAPVGSHEDLLPYLVRRLLENGANSSFVNRIIDANQPIDDIIQDPVARTVTLNYTAHPCIPLPVDLYGDARQNSRGVDLTNLTTLEQLENAMSQAAKETWQAAPLLADGIAANDYQPVYSPADRQQQVGQVSQAKHEQVEQALASARTAFPRWQALPVTERAECLLNMAELLQQEQARLMYLAVREAGKTLADAVDEVREAIDFCRYYAEQACQEFTLPKVLPGPTGEHNQLSYHGRGVMVAISPWNFPLAIFVGQVTAALVAGNTVIAKPAEQTPLIAALAVNLLHQAGIPRDVLQLLPGSGEVIGAALVNDPDIAGVLFTGSTETAKRINQSLANHPGAIVPLIAETGGQNAMIVDSTALLEQVVVDVVKSAFGSAGQRCSALRVLFIQNDVADKFTTMLKGAMEELVVGDPGTLMTDIGPVIDHDALNNLQNHVDYLQQQGTLIYQVTLGQDLPEGSYFAPCAFEIAHLNQLKQEVFGPVLHVIRFQADALDAVINDINATGYGLTLGIHTRIDAVAEYIQQRVRVGNCYVNRSMTGAVVGVQPFGGEGLSGTGPKAGGPNYLHRLSVERCLSVNTTAAGGNASLMSLGEIE